MSQVWPGEEKIKGRDPVKFVLMLVIHDTRFWYHDLIGQITDLWQVSSKYTQVHANVFEANTFQQRKHHNLTGEIALLTCVTG